MSEVWYNDLAFDPEFLSARRNDGTKIRFTRQERALLGALTRRPKSLLSRDRLLAALSNGHGETGERNVDLLITRLRAKLGDKARNPRFIATQYGEGYTWIAKENAPPQDDAFLLIGPVYGLSGRAGPERLILGMLTAALDRTIGRGRRVVNAAHLRFDASQLPAVPFTLEVSFHDDGAALQAAFVLRGGPSRHIIAAHRVSFDRSGIKAETDRVASAIKAALWQHLAKPPIDLPLAPTDLPMELRLHEAARMLTRADESWRESEAQLARARAVRPDDPELAVMWALYLYTRLVQPAAGEPLPTQQQWAEIEDTMETLALEHLPAVQDKPLLVLAIAKVLFFIDRGHMQLAAALAEDVFAKTTGFAAAFAMRAQICMCLGEFGEALALYDRGIELSEHGSEFHLYLLVLKCTALAAANDRALLEKTSGQLFALNAPLRLKIGLYFCDPVAALPPDQEAVLASIAAAQAQAMLDFLFKVGARHFQAREHRRNVMAGLTSHLVRRFGREIMPEHIARAIYAPASPSASAKVRLGSGRLRSARQ